MKKANLPEPVFETEVFFTVTFKRKQEVALTADQETIIKVYKENTDIKVEAVCKILGKSKSYVYNNIKYLKAISRL